jgi:hypothetical protein
LRNELVNRAALLAALKQRLIPLLASNGFVVHPLSGEERASAEMRGAFPLGYLKRRRGENLELLDVQFHRDRFVLNLGVVGPAGIDLPWGHFAQEDVSAGGLPESCRLYSRRRFMRWFAVPRFGGDRRQRAAKTVDRLIDLYPEVEAWFASRTVGPHLRGFSHSFPPIAADDDSIRREMRTGDRIGRWTATTITCGAIAAVTFQQSRAVAKFFGVLALLFAAVMVLEVWNARRLARQAGKNHLPGTQ